jgi:hypothetical protein
MLIVKDDRLRLAGLLNLEERCKYCGSALTGHPLIWSYQDLLYHCKNPVSRQISRNAEGF